MILGAVIGDIIGSPYEFDENNIKTKEFPLISKRSHFTDDTVMTMAVAKTLRKFPKGTTIDEAKFESELIKNMRSLGNKYPYAGYGGRFREWLKSDDPKPYRSYGNGSAMRVSPVAWYFDDLDTVERFAYLTAKVTHNHPEGIKGAQAAAAAIFLARTGESKQNIKNYIQIKYKYNLERTCDEIRPIYHHDGSCQGTVPEAIIAFLEGENFEDAVRTAVSLGGDCDTLTDITAAIAQGMWGVPEEIEKSITEKLDDYLKKEMDKWNDALNGQDSQENTNNKITEMVFILDRSGSMGGLESDTIGGFNSMINQQKHESGEAIVSTILFNDYQKVIHNRIKLSEVPLMTEKDYYVRGNTALLDAIGRAIAHISMIHNHMKKSEIPQKTVFTIITDGMENSSRTYTGSEIKTMIENKKEKEGWEFIFIGANIDAVTTAKDIGISADRAVNYIADDVGTEKVYRNVGRVMYSMRLDREITNEWREEIDQDYESRK